MGGNEKMKHNKFKKIFICIGIIASIIFLFIVVNKAIITQPVEVVEPEQPEQLEIESEEPASEEISTESVDTEDLQENTSNISEPAQEIEVHLTDEEVIETEGNAGALSDNSGSEELLNNIEVEEEESITEAEETAPEYIVKDIKEKDMYAQSDCNIRKGPSTDYDKVGSLSKAQKVTVNGKVTYKDKTWFRLKTTDGSEQFVASSLLYDNKPSTTTTNTQKNNNNKNNNTSSSNGNSSSSSTTNKNNSSSSNSSSSSKNNSSSNSSSSSKNNSSSNSSSSSSSSSSSILDSLPVPDDWVSADEFDGKLESGDTNDGQGGNWQAE